MIYFFNLYTHLGIYFLSNFFKTYSLLYVSACNVVGYAPILVAVATVVLIVLHIIQLRSLKSFLRRPGPHSSNYHHRPTHIFWRMVRFISNNCTFGRNLFLKLFLKVPWNHIKKETINKKKQLHSTVNKT